MSNAARTEFKHLACKFFRDFARMEYALKESGSWREGNNAQADWKSLGEHIDAHLDGEVFTSIEKSVKYVEGDPPQKQVVSKGRLDWIDSYPNCGSRGERLLEYVRRVRNNLFHGGKERRWRDNDGIERDCLLIDHSLRILEACRTVSPYLIEAYQDDGSPGTQPKA